MRVVKEGIWSELIMTVSKEVRVCEHSTVRGSNGCGTPIDMASYRADFAGWSTADGLITPRFPKGEMFRLDSKLGRVNREGT